MRYGNLIPPGDAAYIVPPTGARRLNSAASDIHNLYHAMLAHCRNGDSTPIIYRPYGSDGVSSPVHYRLKKDGHEV